MNSDDITRKSYLDEVYRLTGGDTECQVSMYDIGTAIGLDRAEAGSLAEQLMVQGLIELKTLSGGIGITADGLSTLGISAPAPAAAADSLKLGRGTIITDSDRQTIQLLTDEIKSAAAELTIDYRSMEEIVIDLKTIEIQLLSPQPKTRIIAELFRSLQNAMELAKADNVAAKLAAAVH
jgi:hypothetical protein